MNFVVVSPADGADRSSNAHTFYLTPTRWDDWFAFETTFALEYSDGDLRLHRIGSLKIGQFGMGAGADVGESTDSNFRKPRIPRFFDQLPDDFFSLGQDADYYQKLQALGAGTRESALASLRDIPFLDILELVKGEVVTRRSIMRYLTRETVMGQFYRMAHGGAPLTKYRFSYHTVSRGKREGTGLEFVVVPESQPPTNIHVIIGRNGVGKTRFLDDVSRALVTTDHNRSAIEFLNEDKYDRSNFSRVVSVSFSAFDSLDPIKATTEKSYVYVGLKRKIPTTKPGSKVQFGAKSPSTLTKEFSASVLACLRGEKLNRWHTALRRLEADPIFADLEVARLATEPDPFEDEAEAELERRTAASELFSGLSSGHKIVLLTMTRLVELVEEKSLVLLDEPESHLHPPLLSAFVRALSDLLIDRNGVALVATHSPVVLQEVPQTCAWIMQRSNNGNVTRAERPRIQTFGENVSTLTHEVFGLEVTNSGFYTILRRAVESGLDFDDIVEQFSGSLGGEARSILRGLIATRDQQGSF